MLSNALAERLQHEPISLTINGTRLDVVLNEGAPTGYVLPPELRSTLVNEAKQIVRRATDVQQKLIEIRTGRVVKKWQEFHNRLIKYTSWPEEPELAPYYALLCSWADANRHIAEAQAAIDKGTATASSLGGHRADLSWNSRRLEGIEKAVITDGMLSRPFYDLVMKLG
jgi:hypothetical protein